MSFFLIFLPRFIHTINVNIYYKLFKSTFENNNFTISNDVFYLLASVNKIKNYKMRSVKILNLIPRNFIFLSYCRIMLHHCYLKKTFANTLGKKSTIFQGSRKRNRYLGNFYETSLKQYGFRIEKTWLFDGVGCFKTGR